ncbi:MICOS complex subunit mic25a-like [Coregonus clupeaformis]|uniref:MICOS complex subunit mic25a-like n=1 Tax=Coregonus clupeaformis TaxID=59861 RepID=UPI001BE03A97|nr:MICOS complex subunit mic25a-like [Coregonus clupeaformis]
MVEEMREEERHWPIFSFSPDSSHSGLCPSSMAISSVVSRQFGDTSCPQHYCLYGIGQVTVITDNYTVDPQEWTHGSTQPERKEQEDSVMDKDEECSSAKQLEKKEAELKALDTFFKEQLVQLEKRNLDRYKQTEKQFQDQATKCEALVKARNTEPVCINLQSQILNCYKENREQTLQCSDLAKTYMQCIDTAKKNLLVNHG